MKLQMRLLAFAATAMALVALARSAGAGWFDGHP